MPGKLTHWIQRQANNHKQNLQRLITGAGLFFVGCGLIVFAENVLPSSIEQELLAIAATALCVVGAGLALVGYLSLSILRLISFFNDKE